MDQTPRPSSSPIDFLSGGGDMGARMRAHDWSRSPLGDPRGWPQALKTTVGLMIDSRHPMFVAWGPELALLYNDGYTPMLGKKHPQALGRPFAQVWAEIWDDLRPLADKALAGQGTWSENLHLVMERNGYPEDTWYSFSYSPARDDAGAIAGMFCACTETTPQVLAQRRQAVLDDLAQQLLAADAPEAVTMAAASALGEHLGADMVGYWQAEPDGEHIRVLGHWASSRGVNLVGRHRLPNYGWQLNEQIRAGRTAVVDDVLTAPMLAQDPVGQASFAAINTRAFLNVSLMRGTQLAGSLYVLAAQPRRWTAEEIALVEEVGRRTRDAAERARAEAALRESEARLRAMVQAAPFPMMLHAQDGEILELSRKWTDLTGWSRDELRTHFDWARRAYPDSHGAFEAEIAAEFARDGEIAAGEHMVRTRGGAARIWDFYNVRVGQLPDGRRLQISAASDVTERRRAEQALQELTATLERRVVDAVCERDRRQIELDDARAQVHELQKMETIGQMTGGIAHDFNNMLAPIVGCLDILQRTTGDERLLRVIAGAQRSADRSRTLISRLLAFAGRDHLEPHAIDMGALMAGLEDLLARSLGPQVALGLHVEPGLPAVHADPNRLELAILNLAVNARDAMPEGGTLRIRIDWADAALAERMSHLAPGRYVRIAVADTGCGMDAETLRRSVEPFFTTKGVGKGTGLGLSMVRGLAFQSGGALQLASTPGQGTVATLWLPVATSIPGGVERPRDEPPVAFRPLTIALVDDEDLVRHAVADLLADLGHQVRPFGSPRDALEALRQSGAGVDLLVTDYMMPGMNGAGLVREARALRPGLPAFLITGYARLSEHEAAGLPRLAKPFRAADLAAMIAGTMAGSESAP